MFAKHNISFMSLGLFLAIAGGAYITGMPSVERGKIIGVTAAYAQDKEEQKPRRRTRRVEVMGLKAVAAMTKVREASDLENYAEALEIVDKFLASRAGRNLNSAEIMGLYNSKAYLLYQVKDTPGAIKAYEKVLSVAEEKLPRQQRMSTLYTVAQLYYSTEKLQKSIDYLKQWFRMAEAPDSVIKAKANNHIFLGQVYYAVGEFDNSLPHILKAIELAKASGEKIKENWYGILRSIYYEKKEIEKVRDIVEILAVEYTKPNYWLELSSIYGQLEEEMKQLAVLEVAYRAGYIEKAKTVKTLAQIYMFQGVPYKASKVMAKGLEEGLFEKNADNYKLYAESLVMAQELEDSIEPLTIAAGLAEDGELYMRLAGAYAASDKWQLCINSIDAAFEKGVVREDEAYILRGIANVELKKYDDAIKDFREARKDTRSADKAANWIKYLTREIARLDRLAAATQ